MGSLLYFSFQVGEPLLLIAKATKGENGTSSTIYDLLPEEENEIVSNLLEKDIESYMGAQTE
jgi:hypothetical protein